MISSQQLTMSLLLLLFICSIYVEYCFCVDVNAMINREHAKPISRFFGIRFHNDGSSKKTGNSFKWANKPSKRVLPIPLSLVNCIIFT